MRNNVRGTREYCVQGTFSDVPIWTRSANGLDDWALTQRLVLTSIALDTCCHFTRAAGSIEVRDVLAKNRAQVVFTDTFGIAFTSDSPGGHIDVRGGPCPYALENKVS